MSRNVEYSIFKIIRKLDVAHIKSLAWDRSSNASIPISIVERSRELIVVITGEVMWSFRSRDEELSRDGLSKL
jgi:hypothetical protein